MVLLNEPGFWLLLLPFIAAPSTVLIGLIGSKLRDYLLGLTALALLGLSLSVLARIGGLGKIELVRVPGYFITFRLDYIGAVMVTLISFLGLLAMFFSFRYMERYPRLNQYHAFLLLFIGSMNGAVMAGELFTMFILWELMTLSAFFLVIFDERRESLLAGIKYLIMSEAGALCMLASMIALRRLAGTTDIVALTGSGVLADPANSFLLLLFLIGLGVKAGMFPLHTWLPDAHPAAPSPVSALLSGVMIKVGVFWMIRIFWGMLPPILSWQLLLTLLGGVTIIVGGLVALVQNDIKRLIAYSSISQIGYIIMGIGLFSVLGFAGAFFHLINHALFKGLLFLGAGAVIYRCGTRDMSRLGGLATRMPLTFGCFLVAALALSGIPPLSGFYSKWMIYQALVESDLSVAPLLLSAAMIGTALSFAYIMKVVFSAFFGKQTETTRGAREVSPTMGLPMAALALFCIFFGVFPSWPLLNLIQPTVAESIAFTGVWNPSLATGLLLTGLALGLIFYVVTRVSGRVRTASAFLGGESMEEEDTRVRGTEIYESLMDIVTLKRLYRQQGLGRFDVYNIIGGVRAGLTKQLRRAHTGLLPSYIAWVAVGLILIIFLILGRIR